MAETVGRCIEGLFKFTIGKLSGHERYVCNYNLQSHWTIWRVASTTFSNRRTDDIEIIVFDNASPLANGVKTLQSI